MEDHLKNKYRHLLKIIRMMSLNFDSELVLANILDSAAELADSENASVLLVDPVKNELYFKAIKGEKKDELKNMRFEKDQGIAGWVVKHGKSILVEDTSKDARFFKSIDESTGFQTESIICAPISIDNEVVGVLEILNSKKKFKKEDLELLEDFTMQAAITIKVAKSYSSIVAENEYLHHEIKQNFKLIAVSPLMKNILKTVESCSKSNSSILITGESGTGKELIARTIHNLSLRNNQKFFAINCATLSEQLLESELFGHEKGAFTGAYARKKGKIELASNGTLFLDEIGELKPGIQAKLLRVLQEKTFERIGGTETISVDIRILSATNKNLLEEIKTGNFREDLYYRLNVIPICIPPLRQRKEEIPHLTLYFIEKFCRDTGQKQKVISQRALENLEEYGWPGNIRELQNIIERMVAFGKFECIINNFFFLLFNGILITDTRKWFFRILTDIFNFFYLIRNIFSINFFFFTKYNHSFNKFFLEEP